MSEIREGFPKEKQARFRELMLRLAAVAPGPFQSKTFGHLPKLEAADETQELTVRVTKTMTSSKEDPKYVAVIQNRFHPHPFSGDSDYRDAVRDEMMKIHKSGFLHAFAPEQRGNINIGLDIWHLEL